MAPEPDTAEWGRRLRQTRRAKDVTATQLATSAGISRSYLHRLEAGTYVPSDAVKIALATRLGADVHDLFPMP